MIKQIKPNELTEAEYLKEKKKNPLFFWNYNPPPKEYTWERVSTDTAYNVMTTDGLTYYFI